MNETNETTGTVSVTAKGWLLTPFTLIVAPLLDAFGVLGYTLDVLKVAADLTLRTPLCFNLGLIDWLDLVLLPSTPVGCIACTGSCCCWNAQRYLVFEVSALCQAPILAT